LGNGSNEIIQFVLQAYVWPRQHVLVPEKTFSMYRIYSEMAHLRVREAPNSPDFGIDLNAVKRRIRTATKVIFLANPNNPTGRVVDRMALELFLMGIKKNILVVIDEAYADFCDAGLRPDLVSLIRSGKYPNLVVLRTFSKSFGMAGLRLGYGIACEEVVRNLSAMAQPFNVNSLAAVAAKVSLEKRSHHHRIVRQTRQGRAFLEKKLDEMKIPFVPSQSNFVMLRVGNAAAAADFLEGRGILVRDLGSFGFPEHIRVTVALQEHNRRFLAALKEWCGSRAACRKEA
jgi:histidinol-phosphate aminotransferase